MSQPTVTALEAPEGTPNEPAGRRIRQLLGILRLELRQSLLGRRNLVMFFLAFFPVGMFLLWNTTAISREVIVDATAAARLFAWVFKIFLQTSIFLSVLIVFMSLFRSEIMQRSLHYYLLTPVRREVLVLGKYLSALLTSVAVFSAATGALYLLIFLPLGASGLSRHFFHGPGFGLLLTYLGIAALACAGYGALFLLVGLVARNPVVAAVLLLLWESWNGILSAALKKFSVIFYLESLYPVPLASDMFEILAEPVSAWVSVPGLVVFTTVILGFCSFRASRMEVSYGDA
jgi:ABC-type transport system involved in multi-copper enzyme maturation permease subunit